MWGSRYHIVVNTPLYRHWNCSLEKLTCSDLYHVQVAEAACPIYAFIAVHILTCGISECWRMWHPSEPQVVIERERGLLGQNRALWRTRELLQKHVIDTRHLRPRGSSSHGKKLESAYLLSTPSLLVPQIRLNGTCLLLAKTLLKTVFCPKYYKVCMHP